MYAKIIAEENLSKKQKHAHLMDHLWEISLTEQEYKFFVKMMTGFKGVVMKLTTQDVRNINHSVHLGFNHLTPKERAVLRSEYDIHEITKEDEHLLAEIHKHGGQALIDTISKKARAELKRTISWQKISDLIKEVRSR